MSSQRSTRSVTSASVGGCGRVGGRQHAEDDRLVLLERLGEYVVVGGRHHRQVDREPARAGAAEQVERGAARRTCAPTARRPRRRSPRAPTARAAEASGRSTERCRSNPDAVGTLPVSTAASAGSSTWTTSGRTRGSRRRTSRTWSRSPSASACASSRRAPRSVSTLSPRGFSTVAASVHGPATWTLRKNERSISCACSSSVSRSWASRLRARRWSTPGRVGQPPPGRLEVGAEVARSTGQRPAGHGRRSPRGRAARAGAAGRAARRARPAPPRRTPARRRRAASPHPVAIAMVATLGAGRSSHVTPGYCCTDQAVAAVRYKRVTRRYKRAPTRSVAEIVAEPTTRVPS